MSLSSHYSRLETFLPRHLSQIIFLFTIPCLGCNATHVASDPQETVQLTDFSMGNGQPHSLPEMLPSPRKVQKTSSHEAPNITINDLPDRALERIFILGIERTWRNSPDMTTQSETEVDDEPGHFYLQPISKPFEHDGELLQLMNCAQVCKRWSMLVTGQRVWEKLDGHPYFPNAVRELDPALLGQVWNSKFKYVDVIVPCHKKSAEKSVQHIKLAAAERRTHFLLCAPPKDSTQKSVHDAWEIIRPYLHKHATGIKIEGFAPLRGLSYYHFLEGEPWKNLEHLFVDQSAWALFPENVYDAIVKWLDALQNGNAVAPFPALKKWTLYAHPQAYPNPDVVEMAPHLEDFELNTDGYDAYPVPAKDLDRLRVVISAFLSSREYRIYATLSLVRAVRKPGPSDICKDACWLRILPLLDSTYSILVSEVDEEGDCYETAVDFGEFTEIEDAQGIVLAKLGPILARTPNPDDSYVSASFKDLQRCLRQLIA